LAGAPSLAAGLGDPGSRSRGLRVKSRELEADVALSDSAVLTALKARRDTVLAELAAMDATKAGGKPDSVVGGIEHTAYRMSLYDELERIEGKLSSYDGPFEVVTQGIT
jgi:hypothetical protein